MKHEGREIRAEIRDFARRVSRGDLDLVDDLEQEGMIGVLEDATSIPRAKTVHYALEAARKRMIRYLYYTVYRDARHAELAMKLSAERIEALDARLKEEKLKREGEATRVIEEVIDVAFIEGELQRNIAESIGRCLERRVA